jgi:UDPglucose--hexose-1-phosphate uridylyltransferase
MSTLRQDPLTGRWVIIAAGRGARPNEFKLTGRESTDPGRCPFCPGHEDQTTAEILAVGREAGAAANGPGWRMRVFPNMYPALQPVPAGDSGPIDGAQASPLFRSEPGVGSHEVVVYSPDHWGNLARLEPAELTELLLILRGRAAALAERPGHRYVSPFCNHGPEAGATLAHPHMQVIATPQIPSLVVDKAVNFSRHQETTDSCLLCDVLAHERVGSERVIAANPHWVAVTPWASRFPWEMQLIPTRHGPCLTGATAEEIAALAAVLAPAMRALEGLHGDSSVNLVLHSAPLPPAGGAGFADRRLDELVVAPQESFHWHVEILPRLSRPAGFEAGTGFAINAVAPETAARQLREQGG